MSAGALNTLARMSPAHLKYAIDNPEPDKDVSDALTFGRLVHCVILEPELVPFQFIAAPVCDRRTTEGKNLYADFLERANGKTIVKQGDLDRAYAMRDAAYENKDAATLLNNLEYREISGFAIEQQTGLPAKIRPDGLSLKLETLVDLKTCVSSSPRDFARAMQLFGYHRQLQFYKEIAAEINGTLISSIVIIAVEKTPPFVTEVYEVSPRALSRAAIELEALRSLYKQCMETDAWPGYTERGLSVLDLPEYIYRTETIGEE